MGAVKGILLATTLALSCSNSGSAQAPAYIFLPSNRPPPDECYDPQLPQNPAAVVNRESRAEVAIRDYLKLAATSTDLRKVFADKQGRWFIDGAEQPQKNAHDPWAARVASVERIGFALSNLSVYDFRAAWRATAADGSTLGYYEASMKRGPKGRGDMFVLKLTSPTAPPPKIVRYCLYPNDIEEWIEAKAKRDAKRAAKKVTGTNKE